MKIKSLLIISLFFFSGISKAENVPYSYNPPAGLKVDNVPLFIVMGFDDCMYPDGMAWVLDTLLNKKNPAGNNNPKTFDGTPLYAAFYINTIYGTDPEAVKIWKKAMNMGHEIANHTDSHSESLQQGASKETWLNEMKKCNEGLVKNLGISAGDIWGFRTPFLCQTSTSMSAEDEMKLVYDCSITHEPKDYDRIFVWPYTLDNGTAPGSQSGLGNHPGLWEVPVYNAALDASGYPHMCGMDFSIWPRMITKNDMVNVMKWSLDMRLASGKNRAPMTVGMHPDLYSPSNNEQLVLGWPVKLNDRKASFVEFITYALGKPMVRFVSGKQLITWMRNPVGLDGTSGTKQPGVQATDKRFGIQRVSPDKIRLTIPSEGIYSVNFYSVSGKQVSTLAHGYLGAGEFTVSLGREKIPAGIYMLRVSGKQGAVEKRISIY